MITGARILERLRANGLRIWLDEEGLIAFEPKEALTSEMARWIREHRPKVVEALAAEAGAANARRASHQATVQDAARARLVDRAELPKRRKLRGLDRAIDRQLDAVVGTGPLPFPTPPPPAPEPEPKQAPAPKPPAPGGFTKIPHAVFDRQIREAGLNPTAALLYLYYHRHTEGWNREETEGLSVRDIARDLNLSTNTVIRAREALEAAGLIARSFAGHGGRTPATERIRLVRPEGER